MMSKMSDLISRQWLRECVEEGWIKFDTERDENIFIHLVRDIAPSAQPEQKWIPVTERLPEDGTWNIFSDGETISVERYKMDAIDHFFPQGRWFSLDKAIAWMPLPAPPEEEQS